MPADTGVVPACTDGSTHAPDHPGGPTAPGTPPKKILSIVVGAGRKKHTVSETETAAGSFFGQPGPFLQGAEQQRQRTRT